MSVQLLRFLAMTIGPSITAVARPALTFLAIQLTVTGMVYYELADVPDGFAWLVSVPAIIVAAVLAGLETAAKHDPDIAALMRDLRIDNITGAFGAFSAALLFAALGLPEVEAAELAEGSANLLDAVSAAAASEHSVAVQVGAVAGGVGLNVGLTWLRGELLEFVDDFELGKLWARLETGGVVGVLIILPFLPLLMLGFLLVFALALGTVALLARAAVEFVDRRNREPCTGCDYEVRREASVCPECGTEREPAFDERGGVSEAIQTLKEARAE